MGKLNFCRYLISRFYPTREIRKNLMHAKNVLQQKQCINGKNNNDNKHHCISKTQTAAAHFINALTGSLLTKYEGIN